MNNPKLTPITRINKFLLYGLYCPKNNNLKYIGITMGTLNARLRGHLRSPTNGKIALWFNELKKNNLSPIIRLIKECDSYEEMLCSEIELIQKERKCGTLLFNIADGGDINPMFGKTHTAQAKEKISKTHKGKKLTEKQIIDKKKMLKELWGNEEWAKAVKLKMSENMKGNKRALGYRHTKETKEIMGNIHRGNKYSLGYKHTNETKKLMSINNTGKNNPMFNKSLSKNTLLKRSNKVKNEKIFKGENNPNFKYKISEIELYKLFIDENKKIDEIAFYYGCHRTVISGNLKKYNIKKPLSNKYNLNITDITKYLSDGLNMVQIGNIYGCSNKTIHKYIKNHAK
jgi:hypothetical protein